MYVKEGSNWSLARLLDSSKTKKGRQGEMKLPALDPRPAERGAILVGGFVIRLTKPPRPTRGGRRTL